MDLLNKKCVPCEGGTQPMAAAKLAEYLPLVPGWQVVDGKKIWRQFTNKDFVAAIKLVNAIADIAESEGHHPDLHLTGWNHLRVELWTHAIGGLSDNDFIMAAKVNQLWNQQPPAQA